MGKAADWFSGGLPVKSHGAVSPGMVKSIITWIGHQIKILFHYSTHFRLYFLSIDWSQYFNIKNKQKQHIVFNYEKSLRFLLYSVSHEPKKSFKCGTSLLPILNFEHVMPLNKKEHYGPYNVNKSVSYIFLLLH